MSTANSFIFQAKASYPGVPGNPKSPNTMNFKWTECYVSLLIRIIDVKISAVYAKPIRYRLFISNLIIYYDLLNVVAT